MGCQASTDVQLHEAPKEEPFSSEVEALLSTKNFLELEKIGDEYFKNKKYFDAISVYKKIIEGGYTVEHEIEGLGNYDCSTYCYQWWIYNWYDEQRKLGKFKGSVFDALSLCYCQIMDDYQDELQKGTLWYEDMLCKKESYELYMGYANILYNRYKYDLSIKAYQTVIKLRPTLINAYVCMMFLHEFKRVEKTKALSYAQQVLQRDPECMYAYFIIGKNEKDVDQRIKKLSDAAEKFPQYVRLSNEVGLSHGAKKDHSSAIKWYKKCIAIAPEYAQGYNNIAFRTEQLNDLQQALNYYYKAVEIDAKYKAAFANAIKVFDTLKWTDEDIINKMKTYQKMDRFNFYYYLGLAYYDKPRLEVALNWYKRAEELDGNNFAIFNSMGLAYESLKDYINGERCYLRSIELNPKYRFPVYNMGLLFKHQEKVDKAIEWYRKAIELDPSYHPPYNNLANILRDQQKYQEAIDLYRKCVEIHSTYTLIYCNMAMCYLKTEMYQDAFTAFARAKQLLPNDNNGLSQANKSFLKENIAKFDVEGEKWRKTGSIGLEEKEFLKSLIRSFEMNFKSLYTSEVSFKRSDEVVLKPSLLQLINVVYEDKFEMRSMSKIFTLVKHIFHDDEEYFHIIPQLFIQYFWINTYRKNRPILEVESELVQMIKKISEQESGAGIEAGATPAYSLNIKMKNFDPPSDFKVNLFKDTSYFNSYEILYSEIYKVNKLAEESLAEFVDFVDAVRKRSKGIPYGVNMKLPKRADQQFKVILRILEKMFKKEINEERVKSIISKIDQQVRKGGNSITMANIVHEIMDVWTKQITLILQERAKTKTETTCGISDLLRGKLMFSTVEDLAKAIDACDNLCKLKGYKILELDNRLTKKQTVDVVLKIQVNEAVCEFQLAMKQDESKYHLIHSIYEIERSPLGCIFGSYLFMSKGFNYPILANCKDIEARIKDSSKEQDKKTVQAARYIIDALQQKNK